MPQLSTREKDLRRLHTAGFVTEFGGVSDSDTGRAEVRYVAEKLDQVRRLFCWRLHAVACVAIAINVGVTRSIE